MFESWSEIMGGIMDVVKVPGFLGNLDEVYEQSDAEGATVSEFIGVWWDTYKEKDVGASELYSLIVQYEIDVIRIGDGGERSEKTRLGKFLMRQRDRVFVIAEEPDESDEHQRGVSGRRSHVRLKVTMGGRLHRAQLWKLAKMDKGN